MKILFARGNFCLCLKFNDYGFYILNQPSKNLTIFRLLTKFMLCKSLLMPRSHYYTSCFVLPLNPLDGTRSHLFWNIYLNYKHSYLNSLHNLKKIFDTVNISIIPRERRKKSVFMHISYSIFHKILFVSLNWWSLCSPTASRNLKRVEFGWMLKNHKNRMYCKSFQFWQIQTFTNWTADRRQTLLVLWILRQSKCYWKKRSITASAWRF